MSQTEIGRARGPHPAFHDLATTKGYLAALPTIEPSVAVTGWPSQPRTSRSPT
jgi:hypothetical protein